MDARLKNTVHVWFTRLDGDPGLVESAYAMLSSEERARADRFRFPGLRARFILSHAIGRILLSQACAAPARELTFSTGPQGKPFLGGEFSRVKFNLSHAGDMAAYAITTEGDVGIDIEELRSLPDHLDIARRFFSELEYQDLMSLPEGERMAGVFRLWVRKEAYIKAVGEGLSIPLRRFRVSIAAGQARILEAYGDDASRWRLHEFHPAPEYVAALALRDTQCAVCEHPTASGEEIIRSGAAAARLPVTELSG